MREEYELGISGSEFTGWYLHGTGVSMYKGLVMWICLFYGSQVMNGLLWWEFQICLFLEVMIIGRNGNLLKATYFFFGFEVGFHAHFASLFYMPI